MGPQRGARYEHFPPSPAYVGQCDHVSASLVGTVPKVRDDSEDFGRDPVDWGKPVLQGPGPAEDLERVQVEKINLENDTGQPPPKR